MSVDKETLEKLIQSLERAILWTDEEYDVGPWREEAEQLLYELNGVPR
jgi:hypothetical protein